MRILRKFIFWLLGVPNLPERLLDLERHFVTKRDEAGRAIETLADLPFEKRKELKERRAKIVGNWPQRRAMLEAQEAKFGGTVPINTNQ